MSPVEVSRRAAAIRLFRKDLAALAGVDETTVERTLNGKTKPYYDTVSKLAEAIVSDERRLRDYLVGLHGLPAVGGQIERELRSLDEAL